MKHLAELYEQALKDYDQELTKRQELEKKINKAIKKIEYYNKYCGYDGRTTIHDKELNELLNILEG